MQTRTRSFSAVIRHGSHKRNTFIPWRPTRVHFLDYIIMVIKNLISCERQDDALVVQEVYLILLEHFMTDARPLDMTIVVALEDAG